MAAAADNLSVMGDVESYYAAVDIDFAAVGPAVAAVPAVAVAVAAAVAVGPAVAAYHDNQGLRHHHSLHHLAAVPADHRTPFAVAGNHTLPVGQTAGGVPENLHLPSGLVALAVALAFAAFAASAEALPGS